MKKLLYDELYRLKGRYGRRVRVGLLGLGKTNEAALHLLLGMQDLAEITVRQSGLDPSRLPNTVSVIDTKEAFQNLCEDVLIPSPSVRRERLSIPKDAAVFNDYDLLFGSKPKNLFLVSGSDGKSTTVALTSLLLSPTFPDIFTGGNLGVPLWQTRSDKDAFLLELSSFTLRYAKPNASRALLTNVTPNHLDWHADLAEYENTKLSLIRSADEPILNLSDPVSEREARELKSFCLISRDMSKDDILRKYRTEHTVTFCGDAILLDTEELIKVNEVRRCEAHNLMNLASAIALSIGYADKARIRTIASSFDGLSDRCEMFSINGVTYISSSIDTTPIRTRTTLNGLNQRVRIILGGRGKGLSPEPLRDVLIKYADRIAIYGEIASELTAFIESDSTLRKIPHESFDKFDPALEYATRCD